MREGKNAEALQIKSKTMDQMYNKIKFIRLKCVGYERKCGHTKEKPPK